MAIATYMLANGAGKPERSGACAFALYAGCGRKGKHGMRGVMRVIVLLVIALLLGARALTVATDGTAPLSMAPGSPYLVAIQVGADVIVHADPLQHLDPSNPFATLAYQDEALARSAQLFATSDPARSRRYMSVAIAIADYLVQHDTLAPDGKIGWGLPTAWDAFADGSVNPPYQVYAFQTALVSWALLDMYTITHNSAYLTVAERAMDGYLPFSATRLGPGCHDCRMFWYSTNANDSGRYVKNTNVLMGMVEADLYRVTGKIGYHAIASEVYNEETYEIVQHGDYSYLGVDDPQYSPTTAPEAHIVLETFAYSQLAALLGLPGQRTQATFDRMDATFWNCGAKCLGAPVALGPAAGPNIYAEFMTCYPVSFNRVYAARCARMIATPGQPTLSPFPMIGLFYALPYLSPAPSGG